MFWSVVGITVFLIVTIGSYIEAGPFTAGAVVFLYLLVQVTGAALGKTNDRISALMHILGLCGCPPNSPHRMKGEDEGSKATAEDVR